MKKYLIGFGLIMFFFAKLSIVDADWSPKYLDNAENYQTCKNEGGVWIGVPMSGSPEGKCLQIKDENASCDNLDFNVVKKNKDIKVRQLGNHYQVVDIATVNYDNGYYVGTKDRVSVKCYETDELKKLIKTNNELSSKNICLVNEADLRIKEIDFSRDSEPEWYCPYNWSGQYPIDADPYNVKGAYFTGTLKENVYTQFTPEENSELIHDCSRRIFALAKACTNRVGNNSSKSDEIRKIRENFYKKKAITLWRGPMLTDKGVASYNQWREIKDMSFKDMCGRITGDGGLYTGDCLPKVYQDADGKEIPGAKTAAIKQVQAWLKANDNLSLYESTTTPAKYFHKQAEDSWATEDLKVSTVKKFLEKPVKEIWGDVVTGNDAKKLENYMGGIYTALELETLGWTGEDVARTKLATLLEGASKNNYSVTLTSKYISQRNSDLNVAVSVNQTSHIEVTNLLRAYGEGDTGSKEVDLAIFNDKRDDKPLTNVFDKIIRLAIRTMGTLAILLLIISGVLMVVSQGDDNQLEQAKTVFIYTLIGLIVGFLSYTIVRFVIDTLLS